MRANLSGKLMEFMERIDRLKLRSDEWLALVAFVTSMLAAQEMVNEAGMGTNDTTYMFDWLIEKAIAEAIKRR